PLSVSAPPAPPRLYTLSLHDALPIFDAARPRLAPLGSALVFYPTVGSTNDVAASLATEGAIVIAAEQTAGRGRRGRTWFSPAGRDRKSTRLNSSHVSISYAVFCLKKK